ncbi:MAG: hypothetical protein LBL86_08545 [Coriobacteriales bacterium]|jgi:hypothetical protein|nr:hypothetical protein [Coriobacteriales bacterium]
MKESVKRSSLLTSLFALVLALGLGLGLAGCSSPSSADSDAPPAATPATGDAADKDEPAEPAAAEDTDEPTAGTASVSEEVQGMWFSKSEILPPEQETDQYSLEVAADGSFVVLDGEAELYTGTLEITDQPEAGWGDAEIDGKAIAVQLVNAQGVYKLIINAGDDWDKDLKKIVFMR